MRTLKNSPINMTEDNREKNENIIKVNRELRKKLKEYLYIKIQEGRNCDDITMYGNIVVFDDVYNYEIKIKKK
ncbi:MAG: hypothetical protein ACRCUM_01330 [Mycoplasmoidaceae bacterium]